MRFAASWRAVPFLGVAGVVLLAGCRGVNLPPQVVVVGDVTALGKKLPEPDATHPVYYFPLAVGFKEEEWSTFA